MTTGVYLTAEGLDIPSVETILLDLATDQRATIDPLLNTEPDSPTGQLNGILAARERRLWEAIQIAYNGSNPDAAEGFLLESTSALTGTTRAPATRSRFAGTRRLTINLDAATTVPINTEFHVLGDVNTAFRTTEVITSVLAGDYPVAAECLVVGPIPCNAGTLTVISTPVVGLNSVNNAFDAVLGTNQDNNTELRIRRESELRTTGSGTVDSMRADIRAIELEDGSKPIQECVVLENVTDVVDVNGLPGHSMEALVFDGVTEDCPDDTIAQTIWDGKPGGIEMYGSESGTATDTEGAEHTIAFTRPTSREVILEADLILVNLTQLPSQYLAVVQAAVIAEFKRRVKMGSVIRCNHYEAAILAISGIEDVIVRLGWFGGALGVAGVSLTLGVREIGFIQSTDITVV